jgi:DnaK suppressor protein
MKRARAVEKSGPPEVYRRMLTDKRQSILAGFDVKLDTAPKVDRIAEEDQAQISHDEFVSLQLTSLDYRQLRLIEEALDRLRGGHYGLCLSCEERIPAKRLHALPWARYCVTCEQKAGAGEEAGDLEDAPRGVL